MLVGKGKVFLTVVITESKDSKWGYFDVLASQSSLRKISTLAFTRAWISTPKSAPEKEIT